MRHPITASALITLACAPLWACDAALQLTPRDGQASTAPAPDTPAPVAPAQPAPLSLQERLDQEILALNAEQSQAYLSRMAPMLAMRALNAQELDLIAQDAGLSIKPIVTDWISSPEFAQAARTMIQLKLATSGQRDEVNFELPGNLAAHIVTHNKPLHTLLTADYCIDDDGAQIPCDTGAPYQAGVLVTRAYLAANASRYNLHRAATMLKSFACMGYPISQDLEPSLTREALIPMFQVTNEADDTTGGFGNGLACYSCHGQFGAHAQLFVKFDATGSWRQDASGIQAPDGELGRSFDNLFASHMDRPQEAALERSQMFGHSVDNLSQAAQVLTQNPGFLACSTRNLIEYAFSLDETQAKRIPHALLQEITEAAIAHDGPEPTLSAIAIATFSHPSVIKVITDAL